MRHRPAIPLLAAFIAGVLVAQAGTLVGLGPSLEPDEPVAASSPVDEETATSEPRPASTTTTAAAESKARKRTTTTTKPPRSTQAGSARQARGAPVLTTPGPLPTGIGMWIWMPERADGGVADKIVGRAKRLGVTHLYVRTGSSWQGFHGGEFLERLLPPAHAAGLRVYGWDFPKLDDVDADVHRALVAISFRTKRGHRIDGFVPDLETPSEGTNSTRQRVLQYMRSIRQAVGEHYPLIACVPRPSPHLRATAWPYPEAIHYASAVAPMVYWMNRQPDTDVRGAMNDLKAYGKPIIPVGQAWDASAEGGRPGPTAAEIRSFISNAKRKGAKGVSFWSWQHASASTWQAISDSTAYDGRKPKTHGMTRRQVLRLQRSLQEVGHGVTLTGRWDPPTYEAIRAYQARKGLKVTGRLDRTTSTALRRAGVLVPKR